MDDLGIDEAGVDDPGMDVRELLAVDRASTAGRISALTGDLLGIIEASSVGATDDEHDPEGATIAFERAQVAALLDQASAHLVELDVTLARLRDGSYGTCTGCGGPIAPERLTARPTAAMCIRCASTTRRPLPPSGS